MGSSDEATCNTQVDTQRIYEDKTWINNFVFSSHFTYSNPFGNDVRTFCSHCPQTSFSSDRANIFIFRNNQESKRKSCADRPSPETKGGESTRWVQRRNTFLFPLCDKQTCFIPPEQPQPSCGRAGCAELMNNNRVSLTQGRHALQNRATVDKQKLWTFRGSLIAQTC